MGERTGRSSGDRRSAWAPAASAVAHSAAALAGLLIGSCFLLRPEIGVLCAFFPAAVFMLWRGMPPSEGWEIPVPRGGELLEAFLAAQN